MSTSRRDLTQRLTETLSPNHWWPISDFPTRPTRIPVNEIVYDETFGTPWPATRRRPLVAGSQASERAPRRGARGWVVIKALRVVRLLGC